MTTDLVTPASAEIKLGCGRVLVLHELSFLDLRDGEKLIGKPRARWFGEEGHDASYETLGILLWLMTRKQGVSRDDQKAGKWAFPLDDLLVDFTERDFLAHAETVTRFFRSTSETPKTG